MMRKLIKCFALFMGVFSIFTLIRKSTSEMPSKTSIDNDCQLSKEERDGASDSGFILFSVNSNLFK